MRDYCYKFVRTDGDAETPDFVSDGASNSRQVGMLGSVTWQVSGTFVATVTLMGRIDPLLDFETVATTTSHGLFSVPLGYLGETKVVVSDFVSGTIRSSIAGQIVQGRGH